MKADFEKGTKICSKCKRELPIDMFWKCKSNNDGLQNICNTCFRYYQNNCQNKKKKLDAKRRYRETHRYEIRRKQKIYRDETVNTFQRVGHERGNCGMLKRDYELTNKQLKRRNKARLYSGCKKNNKNAYGLMIWYSGKVNNLNSAEYTKLYKREFCRQRVCAINGHIGKKKPSEHFLFDFDLEEMLKGNVYYSTNGEKRHITKWWKGEIRHWTVNDGIWKE
nr:MAG TPA: restriction endonuclease [Caudoviricetes sp.]